MKNYLFTSESVTEGHPDKVSDQISDAILDAILEQDSEARVACETMITTARVIVSAEITTTANIDYKNIITKTLNEIGYTDDDLGANSELEIETYIKEQSPHIAQGVDVSETHEQGAGDQGLMFGYACNETPELMPLPISLSHRLAEKLAYVRKENILSWLKPDGKSQVTVEYDENDKPIKIKKVVIATQHDDMLDRFDSEESEHNFIKKNITEHVILPVLKEYQIEYDNDFLINGTGRFVEGGPIADVGLTGRKIIVDTYGGYARHGGGAFSGKDPTKVDRSAAYAARYIAKNIVASKIADKCLIQLAYAIGVSKPLSIYVDLFDNDLDKNKFILEKILKNFDLSPRGIREMLVLKKKKKKKTAAYGHFGRIPEDNGSFSWEKTDKKDIFSK